MKKTLKTLICTILVMILLTSSLAYATSYSAVVPTFDVLINGERFYSDPPVIVIEGRTYLPLRAMGDALGVNVEWNNELGQVEVSTTKKAVSETSSVINAYESFDDVSDFGKIAGIAPASQDYENTLFGYVTSYGYELSADNATDSLTKYCDALTAAGFESYYHDDSLGHDTTLFFNSKTGRMINVMLSGNIVVVSVLEETHTLEEWEILDSGATLPVKNYEAVTAGFKVFVDGEEFISENPALVVDGRTYLPLRAMGDVLGVSVEWNDKLGRVEVTQ